MNGFFRLVACIGAGVALMACAQTFETSYRGEVARAAHENWVVVDVQVNVPRDLTASEENTFAPKADIVWQEEPRGDRHAQVQAIFEEGAQYGIAGQDGTRPVILAIRVERFHTLTQKARYGLEYSGVHNIEFQMMAVDARTGQPLTAVDAVRADLPAFVGSQAVAVESRGMTQRKRIVGHLGKVVAGWLGHGDDVRKTFNRIGV